MNQFPKYIDFNFFRLAVCSIIFGLIAAIPSPAQSTNPQTRSITSDDFTSQRPAGNKKTSPGKLNTSAIRRARYQQVQQSAIIPRRKPTNSSQTRPPEQSVTAQSVKKLPAAQSSKVSEIGVTMWRLRAPRATDRGPKIGVQLSDGRRADWTPERVSPETTFRAGDKVRFAVESAATGYLYIVNSELRTDGSVGEPFLIFPGSANEDNTVRPGLLVEVPDQSEDLPYFNLTAKRQDYAGELLTVIVSPYPLKNLKTDATGQLANQNELAELEENNEVKLYAKTDGTGETYSAAEAKSTCERKERELTGEKAPPCSNSRQLTRDEPLPQSIYLVKTIAGGPAVLFVRMSIGGK